MSHAQVEPEVQLPEHAVRLPRLGAIRNMRGLKQAEIARRMRLDPGLTSRWENGERLVPVNRLQQLADALEVSLRFLLLENGLLGAPPQPEPVPVVNSDALTADQLERDLLAAASKTLPVDPVSSPTAPTYLYVPPVEQEEVVVSSSSRSERGRLQMGIDGSPMGPWNRPATPCSCGQHVR
jgi:transcriptional regulator with XRE-family HTH domain